MALPLAVIVLISMFKDAFEDYQRHKSDEKENNTRTLVIDADKGQWTLKAWKDIKAGDIIKVCDDEFVPADLLLLGSSDPKGTCYVETKNLDGETNLKIKNVHKDINGRFVAHDNLLNIDGQLLCEKPNGALYRFEGTAKFNYQREKIPINPDNIILRGSSLKNTENVCGIVVFTGHETKVMMNATKAKYKFSKLELLVNKSMVIVLAIQIILGIIAAIFGYYHLRKNSQPHW